MKLTSDQKYIADAMGVPMPFLPFYGEKEHKERARFLLDPTTPKDDDERAIAWCKLVDGIDIMPKLPVHFRNAAKQIERNERVKSAVRKARDASALLSALNAATLQPAQAKAGASPPANQADAAATSEPDRSANDLPAGWVAPRHHGSLLSPVPEARAAIPTRAVGGTTISPCDTTTNAGRGRRKQDKTKRKPRTCQRCKKYRGGVTHLSVKGGVQLALVSFMKKMDAQSSINIIQATMLMQLM